jgi:hypothetical protein
VARLVTRWSQGTWNGSVPLPPGVRIAQLQSAIEKTEEAIGIINKTLTDHGFLPLVSIVQSNNFSAIVSNILSDQVSRFTPYKPRTETKGPDLYSTKVKATLEVKATMNLGKGGEGHNGHGGWHTLGCFQVDPDSGDVRFIHLMMAELIAFGEPYSDWSRQSTTHRGALGVGGPTGHVETYGTNAKGTAKLRDGTLYYDGGAVPEAQFKRWFPPRRRVIGQLPIPVYSPFRRWVGD